MTSLIKFSIFSEPSTCSTMFVELALEKTHRNTIRESAVIMVSSVDLGLNYMALPLLYLTFLFPNSQELKTTYYKLSATENSVPGFLQMLYIQESYRFPKLN